MIRLQLLLVPQCSDSENSGGGFCLFVTPPTWLIFVLKPRRCRIIPFPRVKGDLPVPA